MLKNHITREIHNLSQFILNVNLETKTNELEQIISDEPKLPDFIDFKLSGSSIYATKKDSGIYIDVTGLVAEKFNLKHVLGQGIKVAKNKTVYLQTIVSELNRGEY